MRVALQKQAGVEAVDVSLERAIVDVRLRAGNAITLAQLRDIIRSNGFSSREAVTTVTGRLTQRGSAPALAVSGTPAVIRLSADAAAADAFRQVQAAADTGSTVELTGTVTLGPDQQEQMAVRTIRILD